MDEDADVASSSGGSLQRQLACDNCRVRKVRCDKALPTCSACRSFSTPCRTTTRKQPRDTKQRVLISSQYEKKIDAIDTRLGEIEGLLRTLALNTTPTPATAAAPTPLVGSLIPHAAPNSATGPTTPVISVEASTNITTPATTANFEGASSLSAHSIDASVSVEQQLRHPSNEMAAALASLRTIVSHHSTSSPTPLLSGPLEPPPIDAVLAVLHQSQATPAISFIMFFPFLDHKSFTERCQRVFFNLSPNAREPGAATRTLVWGGIYYLFEEFDPQNSAKGVCQRNFERLLSEMRLLCPATDEDIMALFLGSTYAAESSRPSLCWLLVSAAAGLCVTLGYHRASSMRADSEETKRLKEILFWAVYIMDKSLSYRLGRASTIQDYDINLPLPPGDALWPRLYRTWIKISAIQGRVYERLYSPTALARSESERVDTARRLVAELEEMNVEYDKIVFENEEDRLFHLRYSDKVIYWSTLTLVLRAVPGVGDCLGSSRMALLMHQGCAKMYASAETWVTWTGYLNWTVIHAPFAPFLVLFSQIISVPPAAARPDLQQLQEFIATLQTAAHMSEPVEKLRRLCAVFYRVAELVVQGKEEESKGAAHGVAETTGAGADMSGWLGMLGIGGQMDGGDPWAAECNAGDGPGGLESWYSGTQHVMSLLEEDLDYIETL